MNNDTKGLGVGILFFVVFFWGLLIEFRLNCSSAPVPLGHEKKRYRSSG